VRWKWDDIPSRSVLGESNHFASHPLTQAATIGYISMKKPYTSVISLLGMFLIICTAYRLDLWIDHIRRIAQQEFSTLNSFAPANLALLLLVALLFVWLWFVNYKDSNIRAVAIIYILVGLGLLFYNSIVIAFTPKSNPQSFSLIPIFPSSLSAFASAFIAVVGIQRLFSRKATL
jgi:hypothetical protein